MKDHEEQGTIEQLATFAIHCGKHIARWECGLYLTHVI